MVSVALSSLVIVPVADGAAGDGRGLRRRGARRPSPGPIVNVSLASTTVSPLIVTLIVVRLARRAGEVQRGRGQRVVATAVAVPSAV